MNQKQTVSSAETKKKVSRLFSLYKGEENRETVLKEVRKGITFTGSNAWVLAGAIIIASVGLNVGSTAVIIGAMLISPLMGPIVGAGFALGTYDFDLFRKSLVNLAIATIISLLFSMLYFLISPIKIANSEILARTFPSLYDVIIAFFGGLVGVIALTHTSKGNVLAGVAIATALMPPICVAGFCIATLNGKYFLGAFFLYTINCVFICLATYTIVKLLKYPKKEELDKKKSLQIQRLITIITIIMIIPSAFFAYQLYQQESFNNEADTFINDAFGDTYLLSSNANYANRTITIVPLYRSYTQEEIQEYEKMLPMYGLEKTQLRFLSDTVDIKNNILNEIGFNNQQLSDKEVMIQKLQKEMAANSYDNGAILEETKILFPSVVNLAISNHVFHQKDSLVKVPVLVYLAPTELEKSKEIELQTWLKKRLKRDTLLVFYRKN